MNKKLQIFVSSTYTDLIEERQAAVEAILDAGHIPAGMELFKAGKNQLKTIRKWIDESDVYMLILGGRYGSIEKESGLSYTELEYRYALSRNMPVFSIVLQDDFLHIKASKGLHEIFEKDHIDKYTTFKENLVKSNLVRFAYNTDQISYIIRTQISDILQDNEYDLSGWIQNSKKTFDSSEELDAYIAKRIASAKSCIYDMTWKDYYLTPRPNYNAYINYQHDFLANAIKVLNRNVFYKEIFTFPSHKKERMEKMRELIKYENYWCGFFETANPINKFPKLHITIIDDSEVIFANYDYSGNLCSICDENIINILQVYFNECWELCHKIKDADGIHQDVLDKASTDFEKDRRK